MSVAQNESKMPTSNSKVLVIGLDGATLDLIKPWAAQGYLPTLQSAMAGGIHGELTSVIPPLTATAWATFMTGMNPGKHGLYDFLRRLPGTYDLAPINGSARSGSSLWRILTSHGKRSVVINVPVTYPPEEIDGVIVSGMLTPHVRGNFTYPPEWSTYLHEIAQGYEIVPEAILHPLGRERHYLEHVISITDKRLKVCVQLMNKIDWDFFMVVFQGTDHIQHALWKYMDESHSRHDDHAPESIRNAIRTFYQHIDGCLAEIIQTAGKEVLVLIMSDHGFGAMENDIHVNTWLLGQGFMRLRRGPLVEAKAMGYRMGLTPVNIYKWAQWLSGGRLTGKAMAGHKNISLALLKRLFLSFKDVDWDRTLAYSFGYVGPIYINLKGREPQGVVSPGHEYENLREELSTRLLEIVEPSTGERLIERVYRREELYWGPHLNDAPDLVFVPKDMRHSACGDYEFPAGSFLSPAFRASGGHRLQGVLIMNGPGVKKGIELQEAHIADLMPTVLGYLNVPIPREVDGKPLFRAFRDDIVQQRLHVELSSSENGEESRTDMSPTPEEDEEIKARLRGLGYIS